MAGKKQKKAQSRLFTPGRLTALAALIILGGVAYVVGFQSGSPAPVNYADPALIARGESLFGKNCAQCHGPQAVGETPANLKGGAKPGGGYWAPALNGTAHAWHHPPDGLFQVVKEGSPAKDSTMVGWQGRMTDEEIHGVLAYIRSLWPEEVRSRYEQAFFGQ